MSLGHTFQITPDEMREIFARLTPHLPPYLRKMEPNPSGWGMRYEFALFTGREEKPAKPASFYDDPKLGFARESENEAEHLLRLKASHILSDLYGRAREEWENAAYVADLKTLVKDAPDRWKAYSREMTALEAAYGYLRTPEAAREWLPAVSRLIDAQDRTKVAATVFDERAQDIAEVHARHLCAGYGHDAALKAAGYPEAGNWHVADPADYHHNPYSSYDFTLSGQTQRLIEQQDAHIAKIGRLSGTATS